MGFMHIDWVYPPPRMQSSQMKVLGFPVLKMIHNPGGDWHPGWGVVTTHRYYSHIAKKFC